MWLGSVSDDWYEGLVPHLLNDGEGGRGTKSLPLIERHKVAGGARWLQCKQEEKSRERRGEELPGRLAVRWCCAERGEERFTGCDFRVCDLGLCDLGKISRERERE